MRESLVPVGGRTGGSLLRSVNALMLREMATTYGRSPGGYVWAIAEPVLAIGLLAVVFSVAFKSPPIGDSFPLFFASAYLPFMLFLDVANKTATAIRFSKPLLAYPSVTLIDVLLARVVLNALTHVVVFVIVIAALRLLDGHGERFDIPVLAGGLALATVLAAGVGTLNCFLFMAYPVYERLWSVATRPLVIVSGLFFTFESMPREAQEILWWNPLFQLTGIARDGIFSAYDATYTSPLYLLISGLFPLAIGLMLLVPSYRSFVDT